MDVFHLTKKEVLELDYDEFTEMARYAWTKFNVQRADLPWRQKDKGEEYVQTDPEQLQKYYSRIHR